MQENISIIKTLREAANLTQQQLSDLTGIPRGRINAWEQRGSLPKTDDYIKLRKVLPIGDMPVLDTNVSHETSSGEQPVQTYIQKRNHQKQQPNIYMVPFVDVPAQAGYTKAYSNIDYIQTLKMYPILPDIDPTGAVWRYFQVQGDSMEDEIREKDVLLASLVPQMDWPDMKDYHTYIIITDEELLIKDILKETEETIILLSQNPKYKARRINLEEVKQIWVMRRHIKNRAKKSRMYNLDEIKKELKK